MNTPFGGNPESPWFGLSELESSMGMAHADRIDVNEELESAYEEWLRKMFSGGALRGESQTEYIQQPVADEALAQVLPFQVGSNAISNTVVIDPIVDTAVQPSTYDMLAAGVVVADFAEGTWISPGADAVSDGASSSGVDTADA